MLSFSVASSIFVDSQFWDPTVAVIRHDDILDISRSTCGSLEEPAARTSWIFAVGLTTEAHAEFFIRQFGDDFPKLCNEEAVSFDSESLQVLQNTQVCSARKVENDAVGEEEAMQRVRQAVM